MSKVDLWDNDETPEQEFERLFSKNIEANTLPFPEDKTEHSISLFDDNRQGNPINGNEPYYHLENDKDLSVSVEGDNIVVISRSDLSSQKDFDSFINVKSSFHNDFYCYTMRFTSINSWVMRYFLVGFNKLDLDKNSAISMKSKANIIHNPVVEKSQDNKHIDVRIPNVVVYKQLVQKLGAWPLSDGKIWRMKFDKVLDLEALSKGLKTKLPKLKFDDDVLSLNREPIPDFDGTLKSLQSIPVSALNIVHANSQLSKHLKKSKLTLTEKLEKFGIKTLYDLLLWLPKRYIDKSKPQDISDLIEGETATIIGKITSISSMPNNMGVKIAVEDQTGNKISSVFWRQNWLKTKFHVNDEVLLNGKVGWFYKERQLSGSSIEFFDEAIILPIVPIYRQSESKGITTNFLMNANRELLSRIDDIKLPVYLEKDNRMDYKEALEQLHFPESKNVYNMALDDLAYYELVYMQIIIQDSRRKSKNREGIKQDKTDRELVSKAIDVLPYELTNSQKKAVKEIIGKMSDDVPSSTLLNADVGAGKTIIAQLACLQSVDNGFQAVILGPTDILAKQLFDTTKKLTDDLNARFNENVSVVFLGGGMKARERKEILKQIHEGTVDIIVGTHSVMSENVDYHNLGLICIDEQQKFGAEQRTKLLNSRSDGRIPDLLMQTATPIPRSTAQVLYGEMDMILLDEKPKGRLPIETQWIKEDPIDVANELTSPMWSDIIDEAGNGNQTFVVAPFVTESDKVDAASVERTYKSLKSNALSGLRVAYAHGGMKKDEQRQVMSDFRNKKYDVLVASTVIEVGVDVPDATRVVVLSADRLGASSLHQIRGRVGRSNKKSICYLVSLGKTDNSQIRLQAMVDNSDGFSIAKTDLETRGEGTIFSSNQSGKSDMIFANLLNNYKKIDEAQKEANDILDSEYKKEAIEDAKDKFDVNGQLVR